MTRGQQMAYRVLGGAAMLSLLAACGRGAPSPPARPTPDVTTVAAMSRDFNSQTGTFSVRVQVANPAGLLRPNQFVRVRRHGGR